MPVENKHIMKDTSGDSGFLKAPLEEERDFAQAIAATVREPLLIIDENLAVLSSNNGFADLFDLTEEDSYGKSIKAIGGELWRKIDWENLLLKQLPGDKRFQDLEVAKFDEKETKHRILLNAGYIDRQERQRFILLTFRISKKKKRIQTKKDYLRSFRNILEHAPAMICTLRGPQHVFELVNDRYLQLVGHRNVIGRPVRKVLPEVENQGFLEILDKVYLTEEPYVGNEVQIQLQTQEGTLKNSYLNFLYHPTWDTDGNVDGIFVYAEDVTEQVETRKKHEESEKYLRKLIDTVPAIIWISNKNGYSSYINQNWYDYTGQNKLESEKLGWLDAIHPEDRNIAAQEFKDAHANRVSFSLMFRLRDKKGSYRWVLNSGRPNFSFTGEYEGMIGTVIDVHEEKIREQEVREKEHRLRTIVEEATVATAVYTGPDMKIELANDVMLDLWGKDREVVGSTVREVLPELEGQPFYHLLEEVYTTGKTYWGKEDKVDLMVGGKLRTGYFNFTYKPLRNETGEIYGILNMAVDVTEMINSREVLRKSEAHFRQLADLMPEKVAKTDPQGEPIYFNHAWLDYTGLSREELSEKGIISLVHEKEQEEFRRNWEISRREGVRFEMEFRCRNKKGGYKWHLTRAESIKKEDGSINHWVISTTEIQKLKEEEKRKEDFLKMVSHELKTPVTSIKGYVQLLLSLLNKQGEAVDPPLPLKPSLERIDHQIGRLTRLIAEMLDLSRIEENKLELQESVFSLNELVDETVQDISYTNTRHQINVSHDFRTDVTADKDRIGQVLINFITNAIKYSPNSSDISVKVSSAGGNKVKVSVRDNGIGIDKKNHKKIFRRFYRVGGKGEETYSGFGIGLFLANEIVQRHNGEIEVESNKGDGATFSFTLQCSKDQ